ncbi:MAG: hypothetical protein FWG64_01800, partial [Firmicutes bacterium]|nr:hypothetical protein [Bacillota bacterium]
LWGILYQEHLDLRLGHVVLLSDFHVLFLKNKNERYPTLHIQKFIEDERAIDYINQCFECVGVKVVKGQKLSKVLSKIFAKTHVDKVSSYQKIFAKMSDLVNHGNEKSDEQLIISLHPCDYLTMSNGNSWTSCHSLKNKSTGNSLPVRQAGGEYSAGTLSYMNDTCTAIAYTLARIPAVNEPLWHVPKKSRVVVYFDFPVGFFVGKVYLPVRQAGGDSSHFTVTNFAETIGGCLKSAFDCTSDNAKFHRLEEQKVHKTPYSLHYIDYCVAFTVNSQKTIDCETGQPAYCVECGKTLKKTNKLSCCHEIINCHCCKQPTQKRNMSLVDGFWVCNDCNQPCFYCSKKFDWSTHVRVDLDNRYWKSQQTVVICEHCLSENFKWLVCCDTYVPKNQFDYFLEKDGICRACYRLHYRECQPACRTGRCCHEVKDSRQFQYADNFSDGICVDCLLKYFSECDGCLDYHKTENMTELFTDFVGNKHYVCQSCVDTGNYNFCFECGTLHCLDDLNELDDKLLCLPVRQAGETCQNELYLPCKHYGCNEWVLKENATIIGHGYDAYAICESCANEYAYCEDCEDLVYIDFMRFVDNLDKSICDSCYEWNYVECATCETVLPKENAILQGYHDKWDDYYENYFCSEECCDAIEVAA